ncbi:MAG: restriction endonuclease [Bacteroidales bacterium]|nr:restriction endonuclease [Bacteroidales bacterium]
MQNNNFNITKKSGEVIPFDTEKLRRSFERSGANKEEIEQVIATIADQVYDGISTKKLFKLAYAILRKKSAEVASRYRLKDAIMELGPSGFPFEHYVSELLKYQGYKTEVGTIVQGKCVTHEVDVIAQKEHKKIMIECKFHSNTHTKSDVKVALYIHSRYNDVIKTWEKEDLQSNFEGWLVTNTRFTEDALNYAKCVGLHLVSWDYPSQGSLRERIDISGLHPITVLQSLSKKEKSSLLNQGVVLCRSLSAENLKAIAISENRAKNILKEAKSIAIPR